MKKEIELITSNILEDLMFMTKIMPVDRYEFLLPETTLSFKYLICNLTYTIDWMKDVYLLDRLIPYQAPAIPDNKFEIAGWIESKMNLFEKEIIQKKEWLDKHLWSLYFLINYYKDVRKKLIICLRGNNIKPPSFHENLHHLLNLFPESNFVTIKNG